MSKIETVTKYKCDGCGDIRVNPAGWMTLSPMSTISGVFTVPAHNPDYCYACVKLMREAVAERAKVGA